MTMIWLFGFAVGCFFLASILGKILKRMEKNLFAGLEPFESTFQQTFLTKRSGITGLAIDENRKLIAIKGEAKKVFVYDYKQVESVEIELDDSIVQISSAGSQIARGAVGAVLLGPAGLLIGALTSKRKSDHHVSRLRLKLHIDDISAPIHRVSFYDGKKVKFMTERRLSSVI